MISIKIIPIKRIFYQNYVKFTNINKDYSKIIMRDMGYPIIPWRKFYSNSWAEKIGSKQTKEKAWNYAKKLGLPVFLKPNSKSQGVGVVKVYTKEEFFKTFKIIEKIDKVILVEKEIVGNDYRIVVLDNEIISAYQRIPLTIVGDGKHSILKLLKNKQGEFKNAGRDKTFKIDDDRLRLTLKRERLNFKSILDCGFSLQLLANANLSTGGTSVDVTKDIHHFYKKLYQCQNLEY